MWPLNGLSVFVNVPVSIEFSDETEYSRTSMARILMARLPWLFELVLESLGKCVLRELC